MPSSKLPPRAIRMRCGFCAAACGSVSEPQHNPQRPAYAATSACLPSASPASAFSVHCVPYFFPFLAPQTLSSVEADATTRHHRISCSCLRSFGVWSILLRDSPLFAQGIEPSLDVDGALINAFSHCSCHRGPLTWPLSVKSSASKHFAMCSHA